MNSIPAVPVSMSDVADQIEVPAWAWLVVALSVFAIYLVTLENGALLGSAANWMHEFLHDGRHFGGVPCH